MFTGIIETLGTITQLEKQGDNLHLKISSDITGQLKVDQSVAHNGICLTVTEIEGTHYFVTAIRETIEKTTIGNWKAGDSVNLERAMLMNNRLDGHIVQGHVDQTATCTSIRDANGSTYYTFEYDPALSNVTIEKGSITVNGVSLTVVNSGVASFSVAIIPYTFHHTNFKDLAVGDTVNLEFDVIGKYVAKLFAIRNQ